MQRHEVRVRQVGKGSKFALQPVDRPGVEVTQRLDRHALIALPIVSPIDDAHPSGADSALDGEPCGAAEIVGIRSIPHASRSNQQVSHGLAVGDGALAVEAQTTAGSCIAAMATRPSVYPAPCERTRPESL